MNDTSALVAALVAERHQRMTPEDRLRVASSLFDTARTVVEASLPSTLSAEERRFAVARRLYGGELPEAALAAHARYPSSGGAPSAPSPPPPIDLADLWHEFPELTRPMRDALRSYARNTQLAQRADWRIWRRWCTQPPRCRPILSATAEDLVTFVLACSPPESIDERGVVRSALEKDSAIVRTPATVRRYLHSISAMHRIAELPDPTQAPAVKAALRRITRGRARQRQTPGLNRALLERLLATLGDSLWDLRARALLLVGYCTLARSAELIALRVEDVRVSAAGDGYALLAKTKTDQEGQGSQRYLAYLAVEALRRWILAAEFDSGPIFRRLHKHGGVLAEAIRPPQVGRIYQALIERLPNDERPIGGLSGHSTRVGAAQDLVASGQDLVSVMQAGGWRDPKMPARYTEHLNVMRGGMARLWGGAAPTSAIEPPSLKALLPNSERSAKH